MTPQRTISKTLTTLIIILIAFNPVLAYGQTITPSPPPDEDDDVVSSIMKEALVCAAPAMVYGARIIIACAFSGATALGSGSGIKCSLTDNIKEYFQDPLVHCTARGFFSLASREVTKTIKKSGRNGGPAFIQNYRNFMTEGEYRGEDIFRQILGKTNVCGYLQQGIDGAFQAQRQTTTGSPTCAYVSPSDTYECVEEVGKCNIVLGSCEGDLSTVCTTDYECPFAIEGPPDYIKPPAEGCSSIPVDLCSGNLVEPCQEIDRGLCGKSTTATPAPQSNPFAGNNIRTGSLDPFTLSGSCTMPRGWNLNAYLKNPSQNGGLQAFERMLQPQNNFTGLYLASLRELDSQRKLESEADKNEALAGRGYTGAREGCQSAPKTNACLEKENAECDKTCIDSAVEGPHPDPDEQSCLDECHRQAQQFCKTGPAQARCTFLGQVTTPADLLGATTANFIDSELSWFVSSDEIAELLIAATSYFTNKLTNYLTSQ